MQFFIHLFILVFSFDKIILLLLNLSSLTKKIIWNNSWFLNDVFLFISVLFKSHNKSNLTSHFVFLQTYKVKNVFLISITTILPSHLYITTDYHHKNWIIPGVQRTGIKTASKNEEKKKKDFRRIYKMMILQFLFFFSNSITDEIFGLYSSRGKMRNNCQILDPWLMLVLLLFRSEVTEFYPSIHTQTWSEDKEGSLGVFPCSQTKSSDEKSQRNLETI